MPAEPTVEAMATLAALCGADCAPGEMFAGFATGLMCLAFVLGFGLMAAFARRN